MTCYNPENFKNYYPPTRFKKIGVAFETVRIPASLGDSKTYPPKLGLYTNKIVKYEADGTVWLYDSLSNYTQVDDGGGSSSVVSVNGKTGVVVLKTSDLENDSGYVTGTFVENAISEEATAREEEDERIEGKVDDVADDLEAEVTARSDADRQLLAAIGDETTARQGADNNLQSQIDAITASSDVTDIVGTYAELQAYDTSTLGDRDIIKVLQDESRNDETTYYRWSTVTQTFTLIGEEGPYYTKAAADTKFQDKLTAGANITISANNEISATDTTYSDFTGTDGVDPGTAGLVPAPATTDAGKYLKADGTWDTVATGPTVVQTTGTSSTDVMSQDATTKMVYYGGNINRVAIGNSATNGANNTVAIGGSANAFRDNSIAIGLSSQTTGINSVAIGRIAKSSQDNSVALGFNSSVSRQNEVSVGGTTGTQVTRYIANVTDPQLAQDAATKNYVDTKAIGTDETYTIADTDWTALSASSPYTYSADVTATYTIGANTIVELINDNPVLFSTYGFAIGAVSSQTVTIYSVGAPSSSVSLTINYKG